MSVGIGSFGMKVAVLGGHPMAQVAWGSLRMLLSCSSCVLALSTLLHGAGSPCLGCQGKRWARAWGP